jgi:hypothetical protein
MWVTPYLLCFILLFIHLLVPVFGQILSLFSTLQHVVSEVRHGPSNNSRFCMILLVCFLGFSRITRHELTIINLLFFFLSWRDYLFFSRRHSSLNRISLFVPARNTPPPTQPSLSIYVLLTYSFYVSSHFFFCISINGTGVKISSLWLLSLIYLFFIFAWAIAKFFWRVFFRCFSVHSRCYMRRRGVETTLPFQTTTHAAARNLLSPPVGGERHTGFTDLAAPSNHNNFFTFIDTWL